MPGPPDLYTFQESWSGGIVRDVARDDIPDNAMYDCQNMLPGLGGAQLRKRAGWTYVSSGFVSPTIQSGIHAPYLSGDQMVVVDGTGTAYQVDLATGLAGAGTNMGTQSQNPTFFKDNIIFGQGSGGSYTRNSAGAFASIGLNFNYSAAHKDRLFVGNIAGSENQVVVSDQNLPTFAGIADNFYNFDRPVKGLAALRGGVLVFTDRATYILRGTNPSATGDINEDFLFPVGLDDAFSITYWNDFAVWANSKGAYMSDGSSLIDLTTAGGIKTAWTMGGKLADNTPSTLCAGVVGDFAVFTTTFRSSGSSLTGPVTTWVCYLPNRSWYTFTNYNFRCYFAPSPSSPKGLYAGGSSIGRVCQVGHFDRVATTALRDGDTTPVVPYVETKFYHPYTLYRRRIIKLPMSRMRFAFISYILRNQGATPRLDVTVQTDPGVTTPGASFELRDGSRSATQGLGFMRRLFPINKQGPGAWLGITTTDPVSDFALEKIELQYWQLPRDFVAY